MVNVGDTGTDYDFGKLMNYAVDPAVAYTLVLEKPDGVVVPADAAGDYQLSQGESLTIEAFATDIREGVGAVGGVASAHANLLWDPAYIAVAPGSLQIAPAFDLAASGSMDVAGGRIVNAGGSFDLAVNGQQTPGAGAMQLLFSVDAQVPSTAASTSLTSLRLVPADDITLKTTVFGRDTPATGDFQTLTLQLGSAWRNPANPGTSTVTAWSTPWTSRC